jgi:hypothetical protein
VEIGIENVMLGNFGNGIIVFCLIRFLYIFLKCKESESP